MQLTFRFFDEESWSIFATLQTILIIAIYRIGFKDFDLKLLVLSSLIAMMQGSLIARVIFGLFLSLVAWNKDDFLPGTALTVISAGLLSLVVPNNRIHNAFIKYKILKLLLLSCVLLWFMLILYMIYDEKF